MTGSSGRKRFLDPALLYEAAEQVADLAKGEGVRVALIGGFAMQLLGSDRLTGDLDFAAESRVRGLPRGKALTFGGEQTKAPNGVPVDVVLRKDAYAGLYDDAVARAVSLPGVSVRVALPEYLAAMKMVAARGKDATDLEFLIASGSLELGRTRRVIKKHLGQYAADEFDRIVDEVTWKMSRGRS